MNHVLVRLIFSFVFVTALPLDSTFGVEPADVQSEAFKEQRNIAINKSLAQSRRKRAIAIIQGIATGNFSSHVPTPAGKKLATQAADLFGSISDDPFVGEDAILALGVVLATKPSDVSTAGDGLTKLKNLTASQSLRKQVNAAIAIKSLVDGYDITKPTTAFNVHVTAMRDTIVSSKTNEGVRVALLNALIAKGDAIADSEKETEPTALAAAKKKAAATKTAADAAAKTAKENLLDATAQTNVAQDLVDNGGLTGDALQAAKVDLEKRKLLQAEAETADTTAKEAAKKASDEVKRLDGLKAPNKDALPIVTETLRSIAEKRDMPPSISVPTATALAKYLKAMQTPVSDIPKS